MFIKNQNNFLMDEATDGTESTGGSAGETTETPPAGESDSGEVDYKAKFEELNSKVEGLAAKKDELLGKVKDYKSKISELENATKQKEVEKAEVAGDKDKLLEFARTEIEELKSQLQEREEREQSQKEKLLQEGRIAEFKKQLGDVEFFDEQDAFQSVDWDKFVLEQDNSGNPIGWNQTGVKEALNNFMEKYSYKIKPKEGTTPQNSAKGGKAEKQLSTKDRLRKLREGM